MQFDSLGKILIAVGGITLVAGLFWEMGDKIPGLSRLGKLPGDINWQREGSSFHFPIVTCILVSVALSILFRLFRK